jgi:hypothetical protein
MATRRASRLHRAACARHLADVETTRHRIDP